MAFFLFTVSNFLSVITQSSFTEHYVPSTMLRVFFFKYIQNINLSIDVTQNILFTLTILSNSLST